MVGIFAFTGLIQAVFQVPKGAFMPKSVVKEGLNAIAGGTKLFGERKKVGAAVGPFAGKITERGKITFAESQDLVGKIKLERAKKSEKVAFSNTDQIGVAKNDNLASGGLEAGNHGKRLTLVFGKMNGFYFLTKGVKNGRGAVGGTIVNGNDFVEKLAFDQLAEDIGDVFFFVIGADNGGGGGEMVNFHFEANCSLTSRAIF